MKFKGRRSWTNLPRRVEPEGNESNFEVKHTPPSTSSSFVVVSPSTILFWAKSMNQIMMRFLECGQCASVVLLTCTRWVQLAHLDSFWAACIRLHFVWISSVWWIVAFCGGWHAYFSICEVQNQSTSFLWYHIISKFCRLFAISGIAIFRPSPWQVVLFRDPSHLLASISTAKHGHWDFLGIKK